MATRSTRNRGKRDHRRSLQSRGKAAIKASPKACVLLVMLGTLYVLGSVWLGNQIALTSVPSVSASPPELARRQMPESNTGGDAMSGTNDTQWNTNNHQDAMSLIYLNLLHLGGLAIVFSLLAYISSHIPVDSTDDDETTPDTHDASTTTGVGKRAPKSPMIRILQLGLPWSKLGRIGMKTAIRISLTVGPMVMLMFVVSRQLTSLAVLVANPEAQRWSSLPDVALTWSHLVSQHDPLQDPHGSKVMLLSCCFWLTSLPALLYSIHRVLYPAQRSRARRKQAASPV